MKDAALTAEWAVVEGDVAIVSRDTGEFWFLDVANRADVTPFTKPMTGRGTRGSTGALLNGAVALGFGSAESWSKQQTISLPKYIFDLVGSYHNAHRAPGHFREAAKRLRELGRADISAYLETHAREETGHDRLVLKDLRALGLPGERIIANFIPNGMRALCALFDELAASDYPIGCIGYSYCFEYTAAFKGKREVDALAALCPPGVDAMRFLRTHSGMGSEAGHVEDIVDFVAELPAFDRIEIVKATYLTARKLAEGVSADGKLSDAQILAELEAAAGEKVQLSVEAPRQFELA